MHCRKGRRRVAPWCDTLATALRRPACWRDRQRLTSALDVCYEWGFDPRLIETRNVVVWHAADDTVCPAEIGRWLAEMFRAREGVRVNFRDDDVGFGHVTFSRGEFAEPGGSMVKALLDGRA